MDQERKRNIAVGITALAGIAGLLALLFLFGYVPQLIQKGYGVTITLPDASGLHVGSAVRYNGIDVGKVEKITLATGQDAGVLVTARIQNPQLDLPESVRARVKTQLLSGAATIELSRDPDAPDNGQPLAKDGSARIEGEVGSIASQFSQELRSAIEGPAANFEKMSESITALTEEWKAVGANLQALSEQRGLDEVDGGGKPGNLATVLARADQRLAELEEAIDNINQWAGDEQLRADFKATVASARTASENLDQRMERVEKRVIALADDFSKVSDELDAMLTKVRQGEGTAGKLLTDPALYNNLNDSAQRLKLAIDEARLLLAKWKAEGVPVQF